MDTRHYQTLLNALKQGAAGRTEWLTYKEKNKWIDLSTADFTRRDLRGYNLSETDLSMAIFREAMLAEADLSDATLSCVDLRRSDLRNAILDRTRLDGANLQEANLADACLEHARLIKARLVRANCIGADLSGADLTGADLSGACLKYVRFSGARLLGVNVSGADLTGAILDDEAPLYLLNFTLTCIDDRKYREMRSRSMEDDARAHEEDSQARLIKVDTRRSTHRAGRVDGAFRGAEESRKKPRATERPKAAPRAGVTPTLRDAEPDLTTVEGCCAVLEIRVNATMDEIVKSFRAKAKVYHPDKVRHLSPRLQELAAEEFRRLRQAYEALTRRTARPLTGILWPEGMPRYGSPYDYSLGEYETLLRVNPTNTNIMYNMAWKYFEEGRYADARAGFERVLALNPNDSDAQYNIIVVRLYSELLLPEIGEGI